VNEPLLSELTAMFTKHLEYAFQLFTYPSNETDRSGSSYVRPIIRFEFGARGVQLPAEDRTEPPLVCRRPRS